MFGGGITENVIVSFAASANNGSIGGNIHVGPVTSFTLVGLQPLTRYTISVVAANQFGASSPTIIFVETSDPGMDINILQNIVINYSSIYPQPMFGLVVKNIYKKISILTALLDDFLQK